MSTQNTQDTRSRPSTMSSNFAKAVIQGYLLPLLSLAHHALTAQRASPKPTQALSNFCGPPFRSPHTLPTEIILQFAQLLDEASLLALRHTNRDLFYIVSFTPDQNSYLRESYYLAALERLTNTYDKTRLGFCISCQELRPWTSFSVSEAMALDRFHQASCLRHSKLWICPHVSYDYISMMKLSKESFFEMADWTRHLGCGRTNCRMIFDHRIHKGRRPFKHYIKSSISVALLGHYGGPGMLRDTIRRHCTRALVDKVLGNFRVPICDHYLLSDRKVRDTYDPTDIDLTDTNLEQYNRYGIRCPEERIRTARRSDGSCSFCQAMGVKTDFRFDATTRCGDAGSGKSTINVKVLLTRSLGAYTRKSRDRPDKHCRCHGATESRLAKFRDSVGPIELPYVSKDGAVSF
jgi:hypothetical protein